jgi:hypothetical protein
MALLVKANGIHEEIKGEGPDGHLTYKQVRSLVGGGLVEHVETDPKKAQGYSHIYLDEEGKLKGFQPNLPATLMSAFTRPSDVLVGDVVFCTDEEDMS